MSSPGAVGARNMPRAAAVLSLAAALAASACVSAPPATLDDFIEAHGLAEPAVAQAVAAQESVAACMEDLGYPYTPHITESGGEGIERGPRGHLNLRADDEFISRHGYGIVDVLRHDLLAFQEDPNLAYRDSLPEDERAAYSGSMDTCHLEAYDAVMPGVLDLEVELTTLLSELDRRIYSDPRVLAEAPEWSKCMEEKGWSFATLESPRESIYMKWAAILADGPHSHDGAHSHDSEQHESAGTFDPRTAFTLGPSQEARADELQSEEVAIATADAECREDTLPFFEDVWHELEAEFIVDNAAFLGRYVDAIRSK